MSPAGEPPPEIKYSEDGKQWWDGHRWLPVGRLKLIRRPRLLLTMIISVIVLGVALFLISAVIGISQPAFEAEKKSLVEASGPQNLQVCSSTDFNQTSGVCGTNRRGQTFQATHLVCSTELTAASPTVSSALLYQGQEVASGPLQPNSGNSGRAFSFGYNLGERPLPGGDWSCRFGLGSVTQEIKFQLQGPTGTLLYPAACSNLQEEPTSGAPLCRQSMEQINSPSELVCSDVIFGSKGKEVAIELSYTGGSAPHFARTSAGVATTPLFPNVGAFAPADVGQPTPTMPPGSYSCRWTIDGQSAGSKDFSVS
ncbi:MAG: hypothetical protein ACREN8_09670 [Candidatus Dormibacteraceae bacterium]